jgi:hypothetical protein
VSVDFFTVPTIRFQVLYVFLVLAHDRRRILHFNVTAIRLPNGQPNNWCRHFPGIPPHAICCAIEMGSSVETSCNK